MAISRFKNGDKKPPNSGRKKGTSNKVSKNIKENFEAVFEKLGGFQGFYKWANTNKQTKERFYQMYSKMLPSNVDVAHSGGVEHAVFIMPRPKPQEKIKERDATG